MRSYSYINSVQCLYDAVAAEGVHKMDPPKPEMRLEERFKFEFKCYFRLFRLN